MTMTTLEERRLFESKKYYNAIPIPEELAGRVAAALQTVLPGRPHKGRAVRRAVLAGFAAVFLSFVVLLNSSPVFARMVRRIPGLNSVAQVFTFRKDFRQSVGQAMTIREPRVSGLQNSSRQNEINRMIQEKVDAAQKMLDERDREERSAYLQTGGKAVDYTPAKSSITYAVKSDSQRVLSFVLQVEWSRAQSYSEQVFYNLDPRTGRSLTLSDLLGWNYKSIVDASVLKQMKERAAQDPNRTYFTGKEGFQGIGASQNFYVNAAGNVVVVFEKYAIAPGAMGPQEFEIETPHRAGGSVSAAR